MKPDYAQAAHSFILQTLLAALANQQQMLNLVCYVLNFTSMEQIVTIATKQQRVNA